MNNGKGRMCRQTRDVSSEVEADVSKFAHEVRTVLSRQTWATVMVTVVTSFITVFVIILGTSPPTQTIAELFGTCIAVLAMLLGLVFLGRAALTVQRHPRGTRCVLIANLFSITWIAAYLYLRLYAGSANLCISLSLLLSTVESVACPWAVPIGASCTSAQFQLVVQGACLYPNLIQQPLVCPLNYTANPTTSTCSTYLEYSIGPTIGGSTGILVTWSSGNNTDGLGVPTGLAFSNDALQCNFLSRAFCILPTTLPPFLSTDGDGRITVTDSSAAEVTTFLLNFVWPMLTLLGYLSIVVYRCARHCCHQVVSAP